MISLLIGMIIGINGGINIYPPVFLYIQLLIILCIYLLKTPIIQKTKIYAKKYNKYIPKTITQKILKALRQFTISSLVLICISSVFMYQSTRNSFERLSKKEQEVFAFLEENEKEYDKRYTSDEKDKEKDKNNEKEIETKSTNKRKKDKVEYKIWAVVLSKNEKKENVKKKKDNSKNYTQTKSKTYMQIQLKKLQVMGEDNKWISFDNMDVVCNIQVAGKVSLNVFDTISFDANVFPLKKNGNFARKSQFEMGLLKKQILQIANVENVQVVTDAGINNKNPVQKWLYDLKANLIVFLQDNFKSSGMLITLITGNSSYLQNGIKEDFKDIGIYHLLAISGMHMAYFVIFLNFILTFFKVPKVLKIQIGIVSCIAFCIFTNFSPSVLRTTIIYVLASFFLLFQKKKNTQYIYTTSLVILLFLFPNKLQEPGLYLSYLGAIGILLSANMRKNPMIQDVIHVFDKEKEEKGKVKWKLKRIIWKWFGKILSFVLWTIYVCTFIQILLTPFLIYFFGKVTPNYILANILIAPIFVFLIIFSFFILFTYVAIYMLSGICSFFFLPNISNLLFSIFEKIIYIPAKIVDFVVAKISLLAKALTFGKDNGIYFFPISVFSIVLIIFAYYWVYVVLRANVPRILKSLNWKNNGKKNISRIKWNRVLKIVKGMGGKLVIPFVILFCIFFFTQSDSGIGVIRWCKEKCYEISKFEVFKSKNMIVFPDVSQADASIIISKDQKVLLIDAAEGESMKYPSGKNVLIPELFKRKIRKIDYLFVSHFDSDHAGGVIPILNTMKVSNLVLPKQIGDNKLRKKIIATAQAKKVNILYPKMYERQKIGEYIEIVYLFPKSLDKQIQKNATNNNSLIFLANVYEEKMDKRKDSTGGKESKKEKESDKKKHISILYTGDVEQVAEKQLVDVLSNFSFVKIGKKKGKKLDVDILKAPHHGSISSSSKEFLDSLNISNVVICCGVNNMFNHPSKIVLKRYMERNVNIFRTDKMGQIVFSN